MTPEQRQQQIDRLRELLSKSKLLLPMEAEGHRVSDADSTWVYECCDSQEVDLVRAELVATVINNLPSLLAPATPSERERQLEEALKRAYDWWDTHGTVYLEGDDRRERQQAVFDEMVAALKKEPRPEIDLGSDVANRHHGTTFYDQSVPSAATPSERERELQALVEKAAATVEQRVLTDDERNSGSYCLCDQCEAARACKEYLAETPVETQQGGEGL